MDVVLAANSLVLTHITPTNNNNKTNLVKWYDNTSKVKRKNWLLYDFPTSKKLRKANKETKSKTQENPQEAESYKSICKLN